MLPVHVLPATALRPVDSSAVMSYRLSESHSSVIEVISKA